MWLAFRMSGFGGLVVPEQVAFAKGNAVWVQLDNQRDTFMLRLVPQDGELCQTYEECVAKCKAANAGNPFGASVKYKE